MSNRESIAGAVPPLGAGEVHVWYRRVARSRAQTGALIEMLADEERRRAARFRQEADRRRYVTARTALRALAAAYLGVGAAGVRFDVSPRGKPCLAAGHGAGGLRFNLSHAGGLVALAFARGIEVGIDVERRARPLAFDALATRVLPPVEAAALAMLPVARRRAPLLACWVCAEALAKARGDGALRPLPVPVAAVTRRRRPFTVPAADGDASPWVLQRLSAPAGYVAALACPAPIRTVLVLPRTG